jgi:hypothetical protein
MQTSKTKRLLNNLEKNMNIFQLLLLQWIQCKMEIRFYFTGYLENKLVLSVSPRLHYMKIK